MKDEIKKFIEKRPQVKAAYGYGSGVFKQAGYTKKDKPQIDLILVVDDLKKWHIENMKLNKKDYSMLGKVYFKNSSISKLKGTTGITYVSNIKENGNTFKYGTIEKGDLLKYLNTWESFYLPGRFQKTVYPIIEDESLKEAIEKNREKALILSAYLTGLPKVNRKDIYQILCGLSYLGDTRMKFAENPRKVLNIVDGSYNELNKIYNFDTDYIKDDCGEIVIDRDKIEEELGMLPEALFNYIKDDLSSDDQIIRQKIYGYFTELNKKESSKQTIKGIYTNGICRSISYAAKKLSKKFKK